jgi:biotin transport system substrate-specific component
MQPTYPAPTIARVVVPKSAVTTGMLMVGFALFTALAAQFVIPIPGSPVPITGQTLAVLLAGAVLGAKAGAGSQLIYWMMGAAGLPFYSNATGGWEAATGATAGYLFGFIAAAWVVGKLAERGQDRTIDSALPAFLAGNTVIYVFGVTWLLISVPSITTMTQALTVGLLPFVIGDAVKIIAAGLLLPAAWKMVGTLRD